MKKIALILAFAFPFVFAHAQSDSCVYVDTDPVFPGGQEAFMQYLAENLKYPEMAQQGNIEGTVYIEFVIEKDGSVSNVVINRDIGAGCGAEAARVIRNMPRWTPGTVDGKQVRCTLRLSVTFGLTHKESFWRRLFRRR